MSCVRGDLEDPANLITYATMIPAGEVGEWTKKMVLLRLKDRYDRCLKGDPHG